MTQLFYNIGQFCGILGFFLLSFLIFSGDTARFWNRFIGLDKIIKFQKKFSYFVAIFVLFHPIFFILSTKNIKGFIIPDFNYQPLAMGIISLYIFICIMIASALYKLVSYKAWQYLHILNYILFFFAFYHAFYWGTHSDDLLLPYVITIFLIIIGIIYRTQYKIRSSKNNKFKVVNIKNETSDTFTISLKSENNNKLNFKAGQFCFLRINKNKLYARHPFTISSSPDKDIIEFTIKLAGRFTETAKDLQSGETVFIDGPFGNFIPPENKKLVFVAGGVGITPFISILRDRISRDIKQNITLIYGSRSQSDIIFKEELDNINQEWFKKVYMLNDISNLTIQCEQGYVREDIIKKYIHSDDIKDSLYYICGPERMKDGTKKVLKDMGVKNKNIFVEDFFW